MILLSYLHMHVHIVAFMNLNVLLNVEPKIVINGSAMVKE